MPGSGSVYHFTDLDTLSVILDSKTLRLFPSTNNDPVERLALYAALTELLNDQHLSNKLRSLYQLETNDKVIEKIINEREKTYISCCSMKLESKYMWNFFGDKSSGVALEIDKTHLPLGCAEKAPKRTTYGCTPMSYGTNSLKVWVNSILDLDSKENDKTVKKVLLTLAFDSYKPKCCELECEYRLIYYLASSNESKVKDCVHEQYEENLVRHFVIDQSNPTSHIDYEITNNIPTAQSINPAILKIWYRSDATGSKIIQKKSNVLGEYEIPIEKVQGELDD